MCGIVGVISRETHGISTAQMDWFQDALVADAVRGLDATGVFSVNPYKAFDMLKVASHPYHLLLHPEWAKWRSKAMESHLLVGHNRKATIGAKDKPENAHPFVSSNDRFVLVHNGYVEDWIKFDPKNTVFVDSAVLPVLLAEHDGDFTKVADLINGAFALVWYDTKLHTLNFVRNGARPLAIMDTDRGIFFASEPAMLVWLAQRNSIKTGEAKLLAENSWEKFHIKSKKWGKSTPVTWKKVKNQTFNSSASNWSGNSLSHWDGWEGTFVGGDDDDTLVQTGATKTAGPTMEKKPTTAALEKPPFVTDPTPWYEKEAKALESMKNVLMAQKELEATPMRLESVPRQQGYNLFFTVELPMNIPYFQNLPANMKTWNVRARMSFPTLESATAWRQRARVLLTPSPGESLISHNDRVLCLIAKGVKDINNDMMLKTNNGVLFGPTEWVDFIAKHKHCTRCKVRVWPKDIRYIAVKERNTDAMQLICPGCLKAAFLSQTPAIQQQLTANSGVDLRQWAPE